MLKGNLQHILKKVSTKNGDFKLKMGDPRRPRKKYDTPLHPWRRERIESERIIKKEYGLKNKKELWKMESQLRGFFRQAKKIISKDTKQSKIEKEALLTKLLRYNLITQGAKPEDILTINLKNLLDRRLQTQVYRQGLARSIGQARQFVVHGHIFVGDRKLTVPSYLVSSDEENKIMFDSLSTLFNVEHPERAIKKQETKTHTPKQESKHETREKRFGTKPTHKKHFEKKSYKKEAKHKPKGETK